MTTQNLKQPKSPYPTREAVHQDDLSARMTQAGEQSHQKGRGAPDSQYGTDSSSKTDEERSGDEFTSNAAPSSAGATESSTGADRDTMDGARSKGAKGGAPAEGR